MHDRKFRLNSGFFNLEISSYSYMICWKSYSSFTGLFGMSCKHVLNPIDSHEVYVLHSHRESPKGNSSDHNTIRWDPGEREARVLGQLKSFCPSDCLLIQGFASPHLPRTKHLLLWSLLASLTTHCMKQRSWNKLPGDLCSFPNRSPRLSV